MIKNPLQLETLKRFYNEINDYHRNQTIDELNKDLLSDKKLVFNKNGHSQYPGLSIMFIDYKKKFHDHVVIQKFIKTPTEYNTSLRVLFSSSGDILCASIKYSKGVSNNTEKKHFGAFDKYLSDSFSPYFLDSDSRWKQYPIR